MALMKKGKVLLIIHDVYQEDNDFPLGPAYLAASLKKAGVEVTVCCQDIFHYSNEEMVEKYLKNEEYDLIGVGFLAARFRETILGLCKAVNQNKKGAWLVLGGQGAAAIPEYVLQETKADIVAVGEAEETVVDLLDCKVNKGDRSKVKGIAYKEGDKVLINERRNPVLKLDEIPFPEWSLFPIEKYVAGMHLFGADKNDKTLAMITSRGCINRCNFCYRMEKGIRLRSPESVVEEIKILSEKYGITYFQMQDELFNFPKERMFALNDLLKKNNLKIKFNCSARVDVLDEETAVCLKEMGCQFLNFGMESSDQKVLDLMEKNATVEENIKAAEITKKVGIGLGLNFIWNNKGDTPESLKGNVELIKKYNTYDQIRTIRPVTPYPGCKLYYEAIEMGLLKGPDDFFDRFKNSDLITVNFMGIPDEECYKLLYEANKELILDHYKNTGGDMNEADQLIESFYNLYFKGETKFRGARHYDKE